MAITNFNTLTDYENAGLPTTESRVALVESTNDIKIDGVNVITNNPIIGDAVFHDGSKVVYLKGGNQIVSNAIPAGYTFVGVVAGRQGREVLVLNKDQASRKYLGVSQFAWTDPVCDGEEHEKTIRLRFGIPNWDTNTTITFTYTASTMAEAAAAVQTAIENKLTELGASETIIGEWWAYADGNRVIIQRDNCTDYRFNSGLSGITDIVWGDMPCSDKNIRKNGHAVYWAPMNVARAATYYGTNGTTPTEEWTYPQAALVTRAAFADSEYCANLRSMFATYEDYIRDNMSLYPQKYGVWGLPRAKELSAAYALATAPTKSGGTMYKYPALYYAYNTTYGVDGIDLGDWFLHGVQEGAQIMEDSNLAIINATFTKMGVGTVSNGLYRWFAQRCNGNLAWFFYGNGGNLYSVSVLNAHQAQAVTLLTV